MKRILAVIILAMLCSTNSYSQNVVGSWGGAISIQSIKLRLIFNVSQNGDTYSSTMDSPDQMAKGIPATSTTFNDGVLEITIINIGAKYIGMFDGDSIVGVFTQNGIKLPLTLTKQTHVQPAKRPQEPRPPFPYISHDVLFKNPEAGITLGGTLTIPNGKGKFPAVILITGSGAQNRNQEIMGHKPFWVIADYLTRRGIAVLRYDDRSVGSSEGNFATSTTLDFASDVQSAVEYLKNRKEIDKKRIGLVGHSEGGVIAPIVVSKSNSVKFIVLLAGVGIPCDELMLLQKTGIEKAMGYDDQQINESRKILAKAFQIIKDQSIDQTSLPDSIFSHFTQQSKGQVDQKTMKGIVAQLSSPWFVNFIRTKPEDYLSKVRCPVLALNGSNDMQVPAAENLSAIESILKKSGNKHVKTVQIEALNHLFQECNIGLPSQYEEIEQTFSPKALEIMGNWIVLQTQ